jgi:hypothetical protein
MVNTSAAALHDDRHAFVQPRLHRRPLASSSGLAEQQFS